MADNSSVLEIDVLNKYDETLQADIQILSNAKAVGYFSVNEKGVYCTDARQLKYVYYNVTNTDMSVNFNLDQKNSSVVEKNEKNNETWNKLNNMFIWVSLNCSGLRNASEVIFVTFRGNIAKLMCSPYENKEDWTICAKFSNGIIYLNSFETETNRKQRESASDFQLKCMIWGFKFEQYMLSDDPKSKPNPKPTMNLNTEFCCVYDRTLSGHRIIYGAEVDGIHSEEILDLKNKDDLSKAEFIELKTSRCIENYNQDKNFRKYKMLKWWCQSYLIGIKTIICGFRNDSGIVTTLCRYDVNELPSLANGLWNKDVCLSFGKRFLDFVKKVVLETRSTTKDDVWKFDFDPKRKKVFASRVTDDSCVYTSGFREFTVCNAK